MILLDTNTIIHYIRGLDPVVRRFQATSRHELRIPSIVAYELEYGVRNSKSVRQRNAANSILAAVPQIPFDGASASEAVHLRHDLERRGLQIGNLDILIAGCAVSRGAVLVTSNTSEFSRIRGLRLLDWTK
jgi:tRNA(fMet)-specific endonuclease VapC